MKTNFAPQRRNSIHALILIFLVSANVFAQTAPVIAEARLLKVEPQNVAEFEKQAKEVWKPAYQSSKQNGRIVEWQLYKIAFAGSADEYNYASVAFYNDWKKTEPNDNMVDMIKAAFPKADPNAILAKARSLSQVVRCSLYERVDGVSKPDARVKYIMMNFMKVKEGMGDAYVASETKDWKPVHKEMADNGKRAGWGLWALAYPGGSGNSYDYVTTDSYETYAQMFEPATMEAFKKVYPDQEVTPWIQKTERTRSLVRSELWELLEIVQ
ncbi:MAG: hypothetical protein WDO15_03870 [Bacteroidota bacterium]